jgi:hypothetical protein
LLVEDDAMIQTVQLVFRHHGLAGVAGLTAAITLRDRFRGASAATPVVAEGI